MGKEFLKFGDAETEKREFHSSKRAIPIGAVNIDNRVIPEEFPCAKKSSKYFFGYENNEGITALCVLSR